MSEIGELKKKKKNSSYTYQIHKLAEKTTKSVEDQQIQEGGWRWGDIGQRLLAFSL